MLLLVSFGGYGETFLGSDSLEAAAFINWRPETFPVRRNPADIMYRLVLHRLRRIQRLIFLERSLSLQVWGQKTPDKIHKTTLVAPVN